MEEAFLHFIWKYQQFIHNSMRTVNGLDISVFEPGYTNTDAGPDFKNAKIRIGEITWNGHVEIHVRASDWRRHNHQHDPAYENVVLHVVWDADEIVHRKDGTSIPALELNKLVDEKLLLRYRQLLIPESDILCQNHLAAISVLTKYSMMDNALARRLEAKANMIFRDIALTNHDWEEIAWRSLARNFGFKTNSATFRDLAKSLPLKILKKEADKVPVVEALLFGQAGFLDDGSADEYQKALKHEYAFKARKYGLEKKLGRHQWKFLRLRPANFPTVRIAQLAGLVSRQPNIFSLFVDHNSPRRLIKHLATEQSDYWLRHYDFGKKAKAKIGQLGRNSIENILVNTVAPLLFAYGIHKDNDELKEKATSLLGALKAENNSIIAKWRAAGFEVKSAFDSQALIEQFNEYCQKKQCLKCQIGADIIRLA
jgi:hypothetical protein